MGLDADWGRDLDWGAEQSILVIGSLSAPAAQRWQLTKLGDVDEKNAAGFRIGVQGDSCT